jgi:DedD protein
MAESEDVNLLKRRGRRRLVGAIALVLAAVIVLPMVFDAEPRRTAPPVNLRIPGEDDSAFVPKVTAKKAAEKPSAAVQAARPAEKLAKAEEKPAERPAPKPAEPAPAEAPAKPAPKIEIVVKRAAEKPAPAPAPAAAERAKAEAALAGEQYFVPVGAYADPSGVIEKLKMARIAFYTEPLAVKSGTITRVRAGPFAGREAADRALQQLKELGLKPGNVAAKS